MELGTKWANGVETGIPTCSLRLYEIWGSLLFSLEGLLQFIVGYTSL